MTYQEKLKDPRWKAKSAEIKELKGNFCAQCHSEEDIEVHHMAYTTCDPWDEPNHRLIPLCECCHTSEHDKWNRGDKIDLNEAAMMGGFTPIQMRRIVSDLAYGRIDTDEGCEPEHISVIAQRVIESIKTRKEYHG